MPKILTSLQNFRDRIKTSVNIKTRNVLFFAALFLVIFLAILLRVSPIFRGPRLIKAFDPWIQWYNAEYLSNHTLFEYFNWRDYKSWYPQGFYRGGLRPGLTFTVVIIYKFFRFLGIPVSLYDVCYFFPVFMAGMTILVMYFLGKEILDRGTGLLAAFFLAFNPGYAQRTMAGFFDNETIGVFATLLTFLFLLKAMRTGKITFAVLGGFALGYLSLSWGGYQFVYLVIPILCIILIFTNKYNQNILISYGVVEGTGLLIFSIYSKFDYGDLFSSLELGGIFLFTIILVFFHILQNKKEEFPSTYKRFMNIVKWGLIPGIVIVAVIVWVAPELIPFGFGARFQTILNPLFRENVSLVASVAEQMPSPWSVFYYYTLIPLLVTPLGIYFCFKRLNAPEIFLIAFVVLMFYFTGSMIRIILVFAPAVSLMGAYGIVSLLKIFGGFISKRRADISRKRSRQVKGQLGPEFMVVGLLIIGFLGIAQIVHSSNISIDQLSYSQIAPAGVVHDWEEATTWMRSNLQGTDVVVSWWDYGYWLTPIGNVTTVNDNATKNQTRIGLTGMALMQTNEAYSAKAFRRLGADYALVYFGLLIPGLGGDEGKWPWMVRICNDNYAKYKKMGMEEDNWADDAVFNEDEYQNSTNGLMGPKWFESQLVKMMFYLMPTNPDDLDDNDIRKRYARQINTQKVDGGGFWKDYIPDNGLYKFNIFTPAYISQTGLVKLYKIDYTILESSFYIKNAEVLDNGFATFTVKNTGTKQLFIKNVRINNASYEYLMGDDYLLEKGDSDTVYVDLSSGGKTFKAGDVVSINVTAQSAGLAGDYVFSNMTSNFFVKEAQKGLIRINRENSKVIQKNQNTADVQLEIENIGHTIEKIDRFYVNDDTKANRVSEESIEVQDGSIILEPGDTSEFYINNINANFYPLKKFNKIGIATATNASDEILFTSTTENYSISILSEDRIVSPEVEVVLNSNFRSNIPIDFNKTHAYTYTNGSTIIKINVKNTGNIIFGIDSIYLTESLIEVDFNDYHTKSGSLNLGVNKEDFIIVNATKYGDFNVNDEILICVTGSFGTTVTSDIGYIHTVQEGPDIKIIEHIDDLTTSFIYANETGKLLIKNTGDEPITIDNIYINNSVIDDVSYIYGTPSLRVQECAIVSFDIPNLIINKSDDVLVNITTLSAIQTSEILKGYVDTSFYNISIREGATSAINPGNLTLKIANFGKQNVTINSIYVNNTYVPLANFDVSMFNISVGKSLTLRININIILVGILGVPISDDDELVILIRTDEGAEIIHTEIVK